MAGLENETLYVAAWYPAIAQNDVLFFYNTSLSSGTTVILPSDYTVLTPPPNIFDVLPSITIDHDSIDIVYPVGREGSHFSVGSFNGLTFQIPLDQPAINNVWLANTNIPGLTPADITFRGHAIFVNVSGLTLPSNEQGEIDLSVAIGPPFYTYNSAGIPITWQKPLTGPTVISVSIANNVPANFRQQLVAAEHEWEKFANIKFQNVASTITGADIQVSLANLNQPGAMHFILGRTTESNIIGNNFHPGMTLRVEDPSILPVSVVNGVLQYAGGGSVYDDFLHELGHAIGLAHNPDRTSVMNPVIVNGNPDAQDIQAIQGLYGPNPDSPQPPIVVPVRQ